MSTTTSGNGFPQGPRPGPIRPQSTLETASAFVRARGIGGSLKWQVAFALGTSILLVTAVLVVVLNRQSYSLLREERNQRALTAAKSLALQGHEVLESRDLAAAERLIRAALAEEDVTSAALLAEDGRVIAASEARGAEPDALSRRALGALEPQLVEDPALLGAGRWMVVAPVRAGGSGARIGVLRLVITNASVERKIAGLHRDGLLFGGLVMVLGTILSYVLAQRKLASVARLAEQAARFDGRTWSALQVPSRDEVGILFSAFNRMASGIREQLERSDAQIREITEAIMRISAATSEILSISTQQAQGAAQQAAGVQEATTTAEEIAATARLIAENSQGVTQVTDSTLGAVAQGTTDVDIAIRGIADVKKHVQSIAEAMLDLGAQSQHIGGIIDIINDISDQTNLLALNAAIEAQGAGEAGRRFAVVAKEVRRLAERTVEATQEIAGIIEVMRRATNRTVMLTEEGYKSADAGAAMVDKVGVSLRNLARLVGDTSRATKEITLSTRQQTSATDEMVQTISEIRDIAQQVLRGAEETSKSISELNQMAAALSRLTQ